MDPLDFLNVANRLKNSSEEEDRRTSVSRSYYAVFNHLRPKIDQFKPLPGWDQDHRALVEYLTRVNLPELQSVGQALKDLRDSRNDADYEMGQTCDASKASLACRKAENAIAKFSKINAVQLRAALDAIATIKPRPRS